MENISCVTCSQKIQLESEEFYEYLGKKICLICFQILTGGNLLKRPKIQDDQPCIVPKNPDLQENSQETCNGHRKKYKFYCDICRVSLCLYCLPNHSLHGFSELAAKAKSLLSELHTLEHLIRFSLSFEINLPDLESALEHLIKLYEKVKSRSASSIISILNDENSKILKLVQSYNADFVGLHLAECRKMIENGRDLMKEPKIMNWTHWCEWNDRCLHYFNLNTLKKHTVLLKSVFPLYCRSASLPYNQVFVCGGRTDSNSPGLKTAFLIHLAEENRIEKLPDMEYGRSNHCVLYYKGFVYVLAGCNEQNQYTNKCERLKIPENKWQKITPCPESIDTCSATALEDTNFIFMTGGRVNSQTLSINVQRYDVEENYWKTLRAQLPFETSVHGSVFINSKELLIFAGQDQNNEGVSKSAVLNIETGISRGVKHQMTKGGCVVNECVLFNGKVHFQVFQGFCSRLSQTFEISEEKWLIEDI